MCTRARFDCVPEVWRSPRIVLSSGGCTVTTCTRSYRHFRHPRASTSLQLDGSNWTTNGHVVIRTRHLSAIPFAASCSFCVPLPLRSSRLTHFETNAESLAGYRHMSRDASPLLLLFHRRFIFNFRIFDSSLLS